MGLISLLGLASLAAPGAAAATLSVDASGGGDYTTIGAAVAVAEDGDVVAVAAGTYAESIDFDGKDIEIVGTSGAASTIIDPGGSSSFAVVASSSEPRTATLEGFTIRNSGQQGVYVYRAGLKLVDLVFEDLGGGSDQGGAVSSSYGGLLVDGCSFEGGSASQGAHIYAYAGDLTIKSSQLAEGSAGSGGSLYLAGKAVASLSIVDLDDNVAQLYGGAIFMDSYTQLSLDNVTLQDNRTTADEGHGAGIYASTYTTLGVDGSDFIDNYNEDFFTGLAYGGALYVSSYSDLQIEQSTFSGNQGYYGGAIYQGNYGTLSIDDSSFDGNYAYYAGAVYTAYVEQVVVSDTAFTENTSYSSFGAAWFYAAPVLTLSGNTWTENSSTYGYGGAFGQYYSTVVTVTDDVFTDNFAYYGGGAIYGYYWYGASTFTNVTFDGNEGRYGTGGALYAYYAPSGIDYTDVTFTDNTAGSAGGGLYHYYGHADLDGVSFEGNEAAGQSGGGAYLHGVAPSYGYDFLLKDVLAQDNQAGGDGGGLAIYLTHNLQAEDLRVLNNTSENAGGGLYLTGALKVTVERSLLAGNEAVYGGGLYVTGGTGGKTGSLWANLVIQQNIADVGGGACFVENDGNTVANNTFVGNSAVEAGSSLCLYDERLDLRNNVLSYDDTVPSVTVYDLETLVYGAFEYNDWYANSAGLADGEAADEDIWGTGTVELAPLFASYDGDGNMEDDSLVLARDSRLIDAGDPDLLDPDGSISDIGAYGGPGAPTQDDDGDGYEAWIDCDDADPTVNPDGIEVWYDGVNQDCRGSSDYDQDGDGYDSDLYGGVDCDDADAAVVEDCGSEDTGADDGGDSGDDGGTDGTDGAGDDGVGDDGSDGQPDDDGGSGDAGGETDGKGAGCSGCATGSAPVGGAPVGLLWLLGLPALVRRRRLG